MRTPPQTQQWLWLSVGCALALLAGCSSLTDDEPAAPTPESPGAARSTAPAPSSSPAGAVDEVAVTGARAAGVSGEREPPGDAAPGAARAEIRAVEPTQQAGIGAGGDAAADVPAAGAPPVQNLNELLERVRQGAVDESQSEQQQRLVLFGQAQPSVSLLQAAPVVDQRLLGRLEPGEELWIITRAQVVATTSSDDDSPGTGAMVATLVPLRDVSPAPREIPLPLQHTDVRATITGYVGTVDVTQQFQNPFDEKIEAVYLFPLPEKAAISEFVMTIGERRIRGILREREQAEQIYAEARAQGYQASLLTQHRPNIFEQKVANIEPGKRIDVNIRYFHTLPYIDGWYSFAFPTVVGPRYNPPGSADPMLALERRQFHPTGDPAVRYLRPDERSGHDISISVDIDAGVAIEAIKSTHRISETQRSGALVHVELASQATLPNRDFVLDFKVAGDRIKSSLLTYVDPETNEGYFTLMMYPPSELQSLRRQPLELVFVLDCSGSMSGAPIAQAKAAIHAALRRLEPYDTFQIIRFSNHTSAFGDAPVPATPENVRRALQYVETLSGSGGTQMIEGIKAALDFPHDPERLRFVTFLTDGFIGNEAEILGTIHERLDASRIFSFGVGSSTNRFLLERMAGIGRGAVAYLGPADSGREVMDSFFDRISHPALIDVELDWNGMRISDVYPARLPDLFVGRSVIVTGKYQGDVARPSIRGRAAGERITYTLASQPSSDSHASITKTWARLRIADLADRRSWDTDPYNELAAEIKDTALAHGLMSDYTAFVAVDASQRTAGDHGTTVFQAVPVPQGVRYETTVSR